MPKGITSGGTRAAGAAAEVLQIQTRQACNFAGAVRLHSGKLQHSAGIMVPGSSKVRLHAQPRRRRFLHGRRRVCISLTAPSPGSVRRGGLIKCVVLALRHGGDDKT